MTVTNADRNSNYITLQMSPAIALDEDSLFDFCQLNSHLRKDLVINLLEQYYC